jgi:hypothetical protein
MAVESVNDRLGTTVGAGFAPDFDWKGNYVSSLNDDGLERFSQYSASPDSTLLLAGPARFSAISSPTVSLTPIGLVDGIGIQQNPSLSRLYEIGSNRSFFTRGKTVSSVSFSKMLADQANILAACTQNSYKPVTDSTGTKAPGNNTNPEIQMNLDSEVFGVPFGLLLVFKSRGGDDSGTGKILTAIYLENCMFANYSFSISSGQPVIMDSVAMEYDRTVPVSLV